MLRQIHIFLDSELLFVKNYAKALGNEELKNVKLIIQKNCTNIVDNGVKL